ncbi:hypothetical protein [Verrucomicrobium sp. BvORR106]|uniref:hypothetical protein n=1 Tax=Verrucomicrobium sp. BvORR106 TaxID=1403819 RepID=UPI00056F7AEC|nr:hypothetical protein [Verrucomicrobium sp. BvORR106]
MPFFLNPYGFAPPVPSFVGPLDGLTTDAVFAVAPGHRLVGTSDPDVAKLYNASTTASQVFKASAGAWGADVTSFVGSDTANVIELYSQVGSMVFSSGSVNSGPLAAESGVLNTIGTGFAQRHLATVLVSTSVLASLPQPFTLFFVCRHTATGINAGFFRAEVGGVLNSLVGFVSGNWAVRIGGGSTINTGVAATANIDRVVRIVVDGSSSHIALDNGTPTVFNPGTGNLSGASNEVVTLGRGFAAAYPGKIAFAGLWSGRKDDGAIDTALLGVW